MLSKERLHQLFQYENGGLFWKVRPHSRSAIKAGDKAGTYKGDKNGYNRVQIEGKTVRLHRIIFMMFRGYLPAVIDHIDRNVKNNCIENLREATNAQNNHNAKTHKRNLSGIKGVCWNKKSAKWETYLNVDKKHLYFGSYKDIDYAKFVIEAMRHKYHKDFARYAD